MKTAARIGAARAWRARCRGPVVFVPTMGALHGGHAALIRRARRIAGKKGKVAVSVFVNPAQFGPEEDFARYPRTFARDRALCEREGVDLLFHPPALEMYAADASVSVTEGVLSRVLCGASRPGHFDGVCTVVSLLFNILRPDAAVFGEKDWQQLAIIRRMVRDLRIPVKISSHPTVRERDGLAMSSRNRLLSPDARLVAPGIHHLLKAVRRSAAAGETSAPRLRAFLLKGLRSLPGSSVDYAEIVHGETLREVVSIAGIPARALVAVRFGPVRLIDNIGLGAKR